MDADIERRLRRDVPRGTLCTGDVRALLADRDRLADRLRVISDANRQRGEEIKNLRRVVETYSLEPCQYLAGVRCNAVNDLEVEEWCGPCQAGLVLSDPS